MLGALCAACDPGPHQDEPTAGTTPVHLVASNVSANQVLPANASIELAFDRLLLPSSVTRQTFILDNGAVTPTIAYDPVARIVTITPILPANSPPGTAPLAQGQFHELAIASPQSATDPNGLRAIDGTTLDKTSMNQIVFMAGAPVSNLPSVPQVDFCNDVFGPVFTTCVGVACHSQTPPPAEGLLLTTVPGIAQTAIGRVAHESNTGASALPYPPGLHFGVNMPIIDPGMGSGGNPANSWLLYKMLMAEPAVPWPACEGGPIAADAGGDANDAAAANEPDADGAGAVATNEGGADAGADAGSQADASLDGAADGGGEDGGL